MDIEFHYYMTYLIAAKAGFESEQAFKLTYSSQYVDNNDKVFEVRDELGESQYQNYISQTRNILKPQYQLKRIYPLFHFVPGDPEEYSRHLEDDCPELNTTPDSSNANQIMDQALASNNLYRIGIACHAYSDTWAHQNFVGLYDEFNALKDLVDQILPNIGHLDAEHDPDIPDLIWEDHRLVETEVDNKERFLEAAGRIFTKFKRYLVAEISEQVLRLEKERLLSDLEQIITNADDKEERIKSYNKLALQDEYGGENVPAYNEYRWFDKAVKEEPPDSLLEEINPLGIIESYTWKDINKYQETHWFKFEEAVKEHQQEATKILEPVLADKEIENW